MRMSRTRRKKRLRRATKASLIFLLIALILLPIFLFSSEPIQNQIYPLKYSTIVESVAEEHHFPPSLIYAVIYAESKFNPNALSSANAKGLMQITDETYQWACNRIGKEATDSDSLFDPKTNITCGGLILRLLVDRFENIETALAAYNAGQGKVTKWLSDPAYSKDGKTLTHIPYEETENYVRRVIYIQEKYQTLYNIP